ncbi:MAG: SH3 domain-containing protein [Parasphingopyxis sp.]|uniref:SH3 domain-containing protein n=1 Tax=Parasphingopyxis sp. TaxID=1920299 RepID=UPI003FA09BCD
MAQKNDGGAGCLAIGAVILGIYLLSQCGTSPSDTSARDHQARDWYYATVDGLRCREAPTTSSNILSTLTRGQRVSVIEIQSGWALIDRVQDCWSSMDYLSRSQPVDDDSPADSEPARLVAETPPPSPQMSDSQIRREILQRSRSMSSGRCDCPDDRMRNGRRCGGNSAWSRPGGRSPICYPGDVSQSAIDAYRRREGF